MEYIESVYNILWTMNIKDLKNTTWQVHGTRL